MRKLIIALFVLALFTGTTVYAKATIQISPAERKSNNGFLMQLVI